MVPYTIHMNDFLFPFQGYDPQGMSRRCATSSTSSTKRRATRRRMMVIGMHDRISGHANRIQHARPFPYLREDHDGVWFARKDEIARWALSQRQFTPIVDRGPPVETGLP